jgi:hypothetical protein
MVEEQDDHATDGMSTMEILRRSGMNFGLLTPSTGYNRHTGGYPEEALRAPTTSIAGLSYIDENGMYYHADRQGRTNGFVDLPDKQSLIPEAAGMGGSPQDAGYEEGLLRRCTDTHGPV